MPLRGRHNASCLIVRFCLSVKLRRGMQFGMYMCWLLSVEQTRINPFIRNPAKLPCRQALHLKCTISYPCLVWMQHFWNIKPGGNTRRMAAATPYIVPPCLFSALVLVSVSLFPFHSYFLSLFFLSWYYPEMNWKVWVVAWRGDEVRLQLCLYGGFIHCRMCFGRSINMLPEPPSKGFRE